MRYFSLICILSIFFSLSAKSQSISHFALSFAAPAKSTPAGGNADQAWQPIAESPQLSAGFIQPVWHKTELPEQSETNTFYFGPNPAYNQLFYSLTNRQTESVSLEIFNLQGHSVLYRKQAAPSGSIDISALPPALYLLKIKESDSQKIHILKLGIAR